MRKTIIKTCFVFLALMSINVLNNEVSAQSDSDYPESLGTSLGVWQIKYLSEKFLEFANFEHFYLEKFPNQDTDNPKRDSKNRVFIQGEVELKDKTILKFKKAYIKTVNINGDNNNYKDIYFETIELNGLSFKFKGKFLKNWIKEDDNSLTTMIGTLSIFKNGKILAKAKLKFYENAEL